METILETNQVIRNTACIICGVAFKVPRAGKLFCSAKCKQFHYYHKDQIIELERSHKGMSDECQRVSLKEYEGYSSTVKRLNEYRELRRKSKSTFVTLNSQEATRLQKFEAELPKYFKELRSQNLSIAQWSFLKLLYPQLRKDDFLKLVNHFGSTFLNRLVDEEPDAKKDKKSDPITNLYRNHIFKIANGQIRFV